MAANNDFSIPHVLVIALDGATYDLLGPWMAEGHLPNLRQLYESGVHAPLESTYPPITGPAWASFITGKSPANHGVMEFFRRDPKSYSLVLHSRNDIDGESIWKVLSRVGKHVGVLGVPLTWPPEVVNGFLVTGLLTPRRDDVVFTYPPELGDELHKAVNGYLLQHNEKYVQDDPNRLAVEEHKILENKLDAVCYLLDHKPWDFFMFHLLGGDILQHGFWQFIDPSHPEYTVENNRKYGRVILDYYKRLDERLPEVLKRLPENTYILVMSDHGFGPLKKYINFNTWLLNKGFLKVKRNFWSQLRYLAFRMGYHYRLAWNIGSKTGIVRLIIRMGRGAQEQAQRKMFLSLNDIDWSRSKVYSHGNYGQMYVNLKSREPQGCVEPGEMYERTLQQLETELRQMQDPATGEHVIDRIWRGSELWQGRYAHLAPDLFFFTKDYQYKAMGLSDFGSNQVFESLYGTHAHHHMHGVFMLAGPEIKPNHEISIPNLVDLAPTIYHLLNVPIPTGLDGHVLTEAFTGDLANRKPVFMDSIPPAENPPGEGFSSNDEKTLMKLLRDLGYVN